jgi:hypothetical protein
VTFQVLGTAYAGLRVVDDGAVMKGADEEDGKSGKRLAVGPGNEICGERHLADVVRQLANHPPEGVWEHRHLFELKSESAWGEGAVLEGFGGARGTGDGLQSQVGHSCFSHSSRHQSNPGGGLQAVA